MKHYIATTIALCGLLLCSCSLEEDSSHIVSPYNFFQTEQQIRAGLNACYDPLNRIHDFRYLIAVEGTTDLASTNGSAQVDAKLQVSPTSPGAATHVWQRSWEGIRYCLSTRAGIDRCSLESSVKMPYFVECLCLEAYYYYVLTSFFGDVPFYEDYVETDEDMLVKASMGRMSAVETRKTLIKELQLYVPAAPQIRTYDVPNNYCGAAMGWMMIAKMAAWNQQWNDVIDACKHLESIYGDLNKPDEYPYSDVMFRNKHTKESIFEIHHEYQEGGIDYTTPSSLAINAVVMPYPHEADSKVYDYNKVTVSELGDRATCYTPLRPTTYMKSYVAPSGTGDIRRDYNMRSSWDGVAFSTTWMGPKFWCPNCFRNYDGNDYKIFRYADALLLMAEAYCETGNYDESVRYLNMIRTRAQIGDYVYETPVKLRSEIRDERGRELFGEFGRKYDLVRWGIWFDQVSANNLYQNVQENIRPCHEYYPIPDVQCQRSGGALSNPEYNKYNLIN